MVRTANNQTSYKIRPDIVCADDFSMSVQASARHHCIPKNAKGPHSMVEVGYPSRYEQLLTPYKSGRGNPTKSVFYYVPADVVDAVIQKHGGVAS